jgi:diketogulonate reductase-like aldo/keto reductase
MVPHPAALAKPAVAGSMRKSARTARFIRTLAHPPADRFDRYTRGMLSRRKLVGVAVGATGLACRGGQVAPADRDPAPASTAMVPAPEPAPATPAAAPAAPADLIAREIAGTGERLPAIGMGTWETFDVGPDEAARAPLREVLRVFAAAGGRVIDTSPMYGEAEAVTGALLADTGVPAFVATKVWTHGREAGERQMTESLRLLRTARVDLMQVHNLLDFRAHITTLRRWKDEGKTRYIGVTHYQRRAFGELESMIREQRLDFVQLPYSLRVRAAEQRLLPAAADHGVAVLVMQPFESGQLFARVRGRPLPGWAAELQCTSWAQIFLKFIIGHPAVHCPLPATRKPEHMADNMGAGRGPVPDEAQRRRMIAELGD